jgi:hypothetical protein
MSSPAGKSRQKSSSPRIHNVVGAAAGNITNPRYLIESADSDLIQRRYHIILTLLVEHSRKRKKTRGPQTEKRVCYDAYASVAEDGNYIFFKHATVASSSAKKKVSKLRPRAVDARSDRFTVKDRLIHQPTGAKTGDIALIIFI